MNEDLRKDIISHRLQSARTCIKEGIYLKEGAFYNAAMARLYYACFHAASALLIANKMETKTHNGVRTLLGKEFVQTGKLAPELGRFYTKMFNKRQDGDYDNFVFFEDKDLEEVIPEVEHFVEAIETMLKTGNNNLTDKFYGAWEDDKSAEKLIDEIHEKGLRARHVEPLD